MTPHQDYREILLTQNQTSKVDTADYDAVNQFAWCAAWAKHTSSFYAMRGERGLDGRTHSLGLHRFLFGLAYGDKRQVDHINGDTLDNRRANLRLVSASQNKMNGGKYRTNTSGYKGVSFYKRHGNYIAQIKVNGKDIHLGYRSSAQAAYEELYVPAALKYHGDFARLA